MPSLAVIPDIHMRRHVFQYALDLAEQGHQVVLLGDYVDNGPRPNDPRFLREIFEFCRKAKAIPLLGNHDIAYLYPEKSGFRQNGYEADTALAIKEVYAEYSHLFKFVYRNDHLLVSHAGISQHFASILEAKYSIQGVDQIVHFLNEEQPPELFFQSPINNGKAPFDGPLWLRLAQYEAAFSSEGITQIVGHSSQSTIRMKHNLIMVDVGLPFLIEW